jgi:DNA primase
MSLTSRIIFMPSEVGTYYTVRVPTLRQTRVREWRGRCPIHSGEGNNFAVTPENGRWVCYSQCGRGGDIIALEMSLNSSRFVDARNNAFNIVGRPIPEAASTPSERLQ